MPPHAATGRSHEGLGTTLSDSWYHQKGKSTSCFEGHTWCILVDVGRVFMYAKIVNGLGDP